jgi:predicted alpha-1,2-mannosidase
MKPCTGDGFAAVLRPVLYVLTVASMAAMLAATVAAQQAPRADHTADVDPLIGTANGGNTYPGASVPFGMVQWSPDTSDGFYSYGAHAIQGFSLTHLSGVGCPVFGDMPVLPWGESPPDQRDPKHRETLAFDHAHESARPGYYSITLSNGTRVELTASARSGIARLSFPEGTHAGLLINQGGSASTDVHMAFLPPVGREQDSERLQLRPDGTLVGTVTAGGFCGSPTRYTLHVAFKTQTRPLAYAFWQDGTLLPASVKEANGKHASAWLDFGAQHSELLKVGMSYVSDDNALANLKAEIPGWDFDAVATTAHANWQDVLGKIDITGASSDESKVFYTGLYHALLSQTLFSDRNDEYMGFDGKAHRLSKGQAAQYTNISDWDIYRNTAPLHALLFPREAADLAQSLVNDAQQLGSYPRWAVANDGSYVMGGDSPPILIAEIYAFGATSFDARTAEQYAVKAATQPGLGQHGRFERDDLADYLRLGYVPSTNLIAASETLEFANADFATAQLAHVLGDKQSETLLLKHAQNWRNLLDPDTHWIRPRAADGTWIAGFDAERTLPHRPNASVPTDQYGFEEGNTYQYTFMLPFDYNGLFTTIGDKTLVEARLDRFFQKLVCWAEPCFNMANEPDFVTPYAYSFLGKPWKTAEVLRRVEDETFNASPGGIPGNDDLGATSGVYLWNTMGLYPAIPGLGGVVLGSPRFARVELHVSDGGTFTVERQGQGNFVESVELNGAPYTSLWLPVQAFKSGDTHLVFRMTSRQRAPWATQVKDLPPSQSQ